MKPFASYALAVFVVLILILLYSTSNLNITTAVVVVAITGAAWYYLNAASEFEKRIAHLSAEGKELARRTSDDIPVAEANDDW